jgi:hypothetical protein
MDEPLINFLNRHKQKIEEAKADAKLAESIKKDLLKKLPKIIEHFSEFQPGSVVHMIEWYAEKRHRFTKVADYYAGAAERIHLGYLPSAEKFLRHIQYKKLLDLQCLWRAGKIELKGIETTFDFRKWGEDIYNCPFLPAITQDEVDLMIRFLNETPVEMQPSDEHFFDYDWHNYEYLKICFAEEEEIELQDFYKDYTIAILEDNGIPPWYEFYDTYMGTKGLLALTDVKRPKEAYYIKLWNDHKNKEKEEQERMEGKEPAPPPPPRDERWYMGIDSDTDEDIAEMVDAFESPEVKKLWENYVVVDVKESSDEEALEEEVRSIYFSLTEEKEIVPLEAHEDWRQGLIISYRRHKFRKTVEAIPTAYDDYLTRIETGIGFSHPDNNEPMQWEIDIRQSILEGRRIAGEPMDFNF